MKKKKKCYIKYNISTCLYISIDLKYFYIKETKICVQGELYSYINTNRPYCVPA